VIAPLRHHDHVQLRGGGSGHAELEVESRARIEGGLAPQHGGSDEVWSPEQLLVAAVALCLHTTFATRAAADHPGRPGRARARALSLR
jgi:organic hydroperoxide reductase OsmC/OhrA